MTEARRSILGFAIMLSPMTAKQTAPAYPTPETLRDESQDWWWFKGQHMRAPVPVSVWARRHGLVFRNPVTRQPELVAEYEGGFEGPCL